MSGLYSRRELLTGGAGIGFGYAIGQGTLAATQASESGANGIGWRPEYDTNNPVISVDDNPDDPNGEQYTPAVAYDGSEYHLLAKANHTDFERCLRCGADLTQ